jgi:hypothetical protein
MDAPKGNTLSFQWTARGIAPYLNRLHRRAGDFEQMAVDVLGSPHRFGFRAGLTSVGYTEKYETAAKRVLRHARKGPRDARCLGLLGIPRNSIPDG